MLSKISLVNVSTDTFGIWVNRTNETINAVSNNAAVVIANTTGDMVTGNGFVNGFFGANTLVCTNLRGGDVASSAEMNVTSNVVFSAIVSHAGVDSITGNTVETSGFTQQTIDEWPVATYRTAKYVVSIKNNSANGYQATELMVMQDDGAAIATEYATIVSNGSLGTFAVDINTGNARLLFTPTSTNTTVNFTRNLLIA